MNNGTKFVLKVASMLRDQILGLCREAPFDVPAEVYRMHLAKRIIELDAEAEALSTGSDAFTENRRKRADTAWDFEMVYPDHAERQRYIELVAELNRPGPRGTLQ